MPVTGLPAASEAALTTLIQTQGLLSWKVVGEGRTTVVVLRFQPEDGQPFANASSQYYRRKAPSQRRRDLNRHIAFQQRYGHSTTRSLPHASGPVDCSNPKADNQSNATEKVPHEAQLIHASVDARSSRAPNVSSVCAPAVSGLSENSTDPIVSTETPEGANEAEIETKKDESSEELTLEVVRKCFEKVSKKMDEDTCRHISSLRSALRSCHDSFPAATPSSPPPAADEMGSGASSRVDAPDQISSRTDRTLSVEGTKAKSSRRDSSKPEGNSTIRRYLRSNCR